jgi:tRNA(fMet)-specific endonuclease VapC
VTAYLLDTNIIFDLVRNPDGRVKGEIAGRRRHSICTSIIVAAGLKYGLARMPSPKLARQLAVILGTIEILPFESPADSIYAGLRAGLERNGAPIGANDLLIAAHALAVRATLVTANVREFARVPRLSVENWLH